MDKEINFIKTMAQGAPAERANEASDGREAQGNEGGKLEEARKRIEELEKRLREAGLDEKAA